MSERNNKRRWVFILFVTALAFGVGVSVSLNRQVLTTDWSSTLDGLLGRQLPNFTLRDLDGNLRNSHEWQGQVVVLNFWATWCPPCVKEMPMFDSLYKAYFDKQVVFVGIAIDNQQDVEQFVADKGISYPILIGDASSAELSRSLGNDAGGLPYTVIFDRSGEAVESKVGEVEREQLENLIQKLIAS